MPLDLSGITDPRLIRAYDYWNRIRGDRPMPSRRDIRPRDIQSLLPHIFLVDVLREPMRFRIRLAGTEVNSRFGEELTGQALEEIDLGTEAPRGLEIYAATVTEREPTLSMADYTRADGRPMRYRRLLCPLSTDGYVIDMLFGVMAGIAPPKEDTKGR